MSVSKDKIHELAYEIDESERRRQPAKDLTRKKGVAEMMLSLSAGGALDGNIKSNTTFSPASHPIEKIGSVFIDTTLFLLQHRGCPPAARDVALAICGLTGGNYQTFTKLTQQQIGDRLGIMPPAVRAKLEKLVEWEQRENCNIIQVKQNERNKTSRQFEITEYRPIIVRFAAEYIRRCAQKGLPPINRQKEITPKTEEIYNQIADDIYEEVPEAALIPRTAKNVTPKQAKINFIESKQERIMRDFEDLRKAIDTQSYDAQKVWKETVVLAEKAFFGLE